ncbi:hypothetical protein SBA5_40010 [Candidatus Sulfotelmatomonas gaucii]|uniref:Uncharacterized protein n=1 Tax=Candidatus Sulfuritelmatomonas gaucii TaxID=2043161 RepID=A0A2N9LKB6_9BACT|nr:hypothetical protein SBA5_40010 [Candidatus Sulfotelmatomonas gaucii]
MPFRSGGESGQGPEKTRLSLSDEWLKEDWERFYASRAQPQSNVHHKSMFFLGIPGIEPCRRAFAAVGTNPAHHRLAGHRPAERSDTLKTRSR